MGISLKKCCQNQNQIEGFKDKESNPETEEKKFILRSNPKSIAQKIENRKNTPSLEDRYQIKNSISPNFDIYFDQQKVKFSNGSPHPSTAFQSNKMNTNKKTEENFNITNSYNSSKKINNNPYFKEDINKFLTFEHSHRQMSLLTFRTLNNKELNRKLDELLEKEAKINKLLYPQIEFNVAGIIEKTFQYNYQISKDKTCEPNYEYNNIKTDPQVKTKSDCYNSLSSETFFNTFSHSSSNFHFFVISNIFIYDFEYLISENSLELKRKLHLLSIDFFSITPDFHKLIIHVNNIIDRGGNICITHENSIHLVFCLCNILFYNYSIIKNLVTIPKSLYFFEISKRIFHYEKMKEFFNKYTEDIFKQIGFVVPYDENEELVKMIPLSKIEFKFTDTKTDKLLLLTNKKVLEISNENFDYSEINIFLLSKMKKIYIYNKSHKFQIIYEDENIYQYSTVNSRVLISLIKTLHSKECLLELEVVRMD